MFLNGDIANPRDRLAYDTGLAWSLLRWAVVSRRMVVSLSRKPPVANLHQSVYGDVNDEATATLRARLGLVNSSELDKTPFQSMRRFHSTDPAAYLKRAFGYHKSSAGPADPGAPWFRRDLVADIWDWARPEERSYSQTRITASSRREEFQKQQE